MKRKSAFYIDASISKENCEIGGCFMNKKEIRIALGDGDGCFSNVSFWKDYFECINCEFIHFEDDLNNLDDIDPMFPSIVCLNTKQRLSRATKLAQHKLTHIIYFLRDDKTVHNCPSSIYRVQWLKEYWKRYNVEVIVWKEDLLPEASDLDNLRALAERLNRTDEFLNLDLVKIGVLSTNLPKRKRAYDFTRIDGRKTFLLIGVSPHLIDPYRKSKTMDYLLSKYNVIFPHFETTHFQLPEKPECGLKLYKIEGIYEAIRMVMDNELKADGIIFTSDAFDVPGRYAFPIIKSHLNELGVFEYKKCEKISDNKMKYLSLIISYKNQEDCIKKIEEFANEI